MELLGKAQSKEFWLGVREKEYFSPYVDRIKRAYDERVARGGIKALKYSEFKTFFTTGNRSVYEGNYFDRRSLMENSALLALIYPEKQEYLDTLMDTVYAICDEYTWCLPAHQGKLEPNNNCRIDLFASETGYALAEIYTVLGDRLEPLIKNRIKAEIDRRIVSPFTDVDFYGWWENDRLNWTGVCMGSVSCTLMLMRPELVNAKYLERLKKSFECFLSGFDADGICYEGAGYWGYGFGFFVQCADMLRTFTAGELDYFKQEKVRRISTYHQKMFLSGNRSVSFADGGSVISQPIYLIHFLKKEYPEDILVYSLRYGNDGAGEFSYHLRFFAWFDEEAYLDPADKDAAFEFFAPEAQWLIKKTPCYGFAAKGGCNGEFHNHNDVGSFIFAKDGEHIFTDLGSGIYTRQYFDGNSRYSFLECSSRGHSVPIVDGVCQSPGGGFAARRTEYGDGYFSLDIAGAYECKGLGGIVREFKMDDASVTVTDTFDYSGEGEIVDRIVTRYEPKVISEREIAVGNGRLTVDPLTCRISINQEPDSRNNIVWFIDLTLKEGVRQTSYQIK